METQYNTQTLVIPQKTNFIAGRGHNLHFHCTVYTCMHSRTAHINEHTDTHPLLPCLPDIPSKILRKRKGIC